MVFLTNVALGGSTLTFTGQGSAATNGYGSNRFNVSMEIDGNISGSGGLAVNTGAITDAAGAVLLTGANTYTGATTVQSGQLIASSVGSLSGSNVVVDNGAMLYVVNNLTTTAPLAISGTGVTSANPGGQQWGALLGGGGTNNGSGPTSEYDGPITLTGDATIGVIGVIDTFILTGGINTQGHQLTLGSENQSSGAARSRYHLPAPISGAGNVVVDSEAARTFGVANTYTGTTTLTNGGVLVAAWRPRCAASAAGRWRHGGRTLGSDHGPGRQHWLFHFEPRCAPGHPPRPSPARPHPRSFLMATV